MWIVALIDESGLVQEHVFVAGITAAAKQAKELYAKKDVFVNSTIQVSRLTFGPSYKYDGTDSSLKSINDTEEVE